MWLCSLHCFSTLRLLTQMKVGSLIFFRKIISYIDLGFHCTIHIFSSSSNQTYLWQLLRLACNTTGSAIYQA